MSSNCCRSCGKTYEDELKTSINDMIEGKSTYKEIIERNMGSKLNADKFLPQMICDVCKAQLELICALGFGWKSNEKALVTPNKIREAVSQIAIDFQRDEDFNSPPPGYARKRGPIPKVKVKTEPEERPFFLYSQIPNYYDQSSASKASKSVNCFNNIRELFAEELAFKDVLKDLENYSHIRVDQEYLTEHGELHPDWLEAFDGTMKWTDFVYQCSHCDTEVAGLFAYLEHMREAGVKTFKINCNENPCTREFAALYSYINHLGDHHKHLRFSCIFCNPTRIYFNIPCLINHYLASHADINFQIYVCIECGHYCQNITQLRVHKMSQHDKVQDVDNDSSGDSDEEKKPKKQKMSDDFDWKLPVPSGLKRVKSRSLNTLNAVPSNYNLARKSLEGYPGKTFHPKVQNVSNRITYPCTVEGCDRVLITPAGLEYHLLTHSGEKPYKCSICNKAFRSKALLSNHESAKHCVNK